MEMDDQHINVMNICGCCEMHLIKGEQTDSTGNLEGTSPCLCLWTQLLVWPESSPDDIRVVTITPDYPSARHTGLVSGLKKYTWYFGSALCFTTPGDGPRSPPTLLQTHEDGECTEMPHGNVTTKGHSCQPRLGIIIITGYYNMCSHLSFFSLCVVL